MPGTLQDPPPLFPPRAAGVSLIFTSGVAWHSGLNQLGALSYANPRCQTKLRRVEGSAGQ